MTRPHLIVSGVVVGLLLISTFTPSHAEKPIEPLMDQCLLRLAWQSTEEEVATMADACPLLLLKLQERGWVETLEGIAAEDLTAAQLSTYVEARDLLCLVEQHRWLQVADAVTGHQVQQEQRLDRA